MGKEFRILAINPGSTSTKLALYMDDVCLMDENVDVDPQLVRSCTGVFDQYELRMNSIESFLAENKIDLRDIDCFASRGCGGGNQKAGAYIIDEEYLKLCRSNGIPHISNLSPLLAYDLAKKYGGSAYVYDAEGVNERDPLTLISGMKELKMNSGSHVLNAKIVARKAAERLGKSYENACIVVCHMGGGVSTSCHKNGKLLDSCYDAYAPERTGGIPGSAALNFLKLCYSGQYTEAQMKKLLIGGGGLKSYLGSSDLREIEKRIDKGDQQAKFYFDGMALTLAKDIASVSAYASMDVDAIALTGGMANSSRLCSAITARIDKIAPVLLFPGSYEMENLASGVLRVLRGQEDYHCYISEQREERNET